MVIVERQLLGRLERRLQIVNQGIDTARLEEVRRNDRRRIHAARDGVRTKLLHVRQRLRADVRNQIKLALRSLHPGIKDGLALVQRTANALTRRARNIDTGHLLLDQHGNLLRNDIEIDGPIRLETSVCGGNETLQLLNFHNFPLV